MKENIVEILSCPDCGGKLRLIKYTTKSMIINGERKEEIWEGILKCDKCGRYFPIIQGVLWIYPKKLMRRDIMNKLIREEQ